MTWSGDIDGLDSLLDKVVSEQYINFSMTNFFHNICIGIFYYNNFFKFWFLAIPLQVFSKN